MVDIIGTPNNDTLVGTEQADTISGGDGNDTITGLGGDDTLFGEAGIDTLNGDGGDDSLDGGDGEDVLNGGDGLDRLIGGAGNDQLNGDAGQDMLIGGAGADSADGGEGDDLLYGETDVADADGAADLLVGGAGADVIFGGGGNDRLWSAERLAGSLVYSGQDDLGLDRDRLFGGTGADQISIGFGDEADGGSSINSTTGAQNVDILRLSLGGSGVGLTLDTQVLASRVAATSNGSMLTDYGLAVRNFELLTYVRASQFDDRIDAVAGGVTVDAGAGNDVILTGSAAVTVSGGDGDDYFESSALADRFDGGNGADTVDYRKAAGAMRIELGRTSAINGAASDGDVLIRVQNVDGSSFSDVIIGADDGNVLRGMAGDDRLEGNGGADTLDGGVGVDVMDGGLGNDVFLVDNAGDIVLEAVGQGSDRVFASTSYRLVAGSAVELLTTDSNFGLAAIDLTGNELGNAIYGNAGNNRLDGGLGADALVGFEGDDAYVVDDAGDRVIEAAGGGSDRVFAAVSYRLEAGSAVELLTTDFNAGTTAIDLTGNELANLIYGNAGANRLSGGAGNDSLVGFEGDDSLDGGAGSDDLVGGVGNDSYLIDSVGDRVFEAVGEGMDRVFASVSYRLTAGAAVEMLTTDFNAGTAAIDLAGNELGNAIYGNAGSNRLDGGAGADTLVGFGGDDSYVVDNAGDRVVELGGEGSDRVFASVSYSLELGAAVEILSTDFNAGTAAINLVGNDLANVIYGNDGANRLDGGGGADTLAGFGGADIFVFSTPLGGSNVDYVAGFDTGSDRIELARSVFAALQPGGLAAGSFVAGPRAQDADDRIIYDAATGALFYDSDGTGAAEAIQFATLDPNRALTAADFVIV